MDYAAEPDFAIAALMHMLVRYPMTWCDPLADSIEAHFEFIAGSERYSGPLRTAAARAGSEWKAMRTMQRAISRQSKRCD
ncbi:MAG TPA: hypothetical protein VHP37_19325 [Burkholderiales bacterium]|nr:hypothetical protein [Burkholderiales bacterium]